MTICAELKNHFVNLLRSQRAFTMAYAAALKQASQDIKHPWRKWTTALEANKLLRTNYTVIKDCLLKNKAMIDNMFFERITQKMNNGEILTKGELRFLYIPSRWPDFIDKIIEITQRRDQRQDLSRLLGCNPEQISLTREEAVGGNIKYHYGNLFVLSEDLSSNKTLQLPGIVLGNLECNLSDVDLAEHLVLPKEIGGELRLENLKSGHKITLPDRVGGLWLESLEDCNALKLPSHIKYNLTFTRLASVKELSFPAPFNIGGQIRFSGLFLANHELKGLKARYPQLADKMIIQ